MKTESLMRRENGGAFKNSTDDNIVPHNES